MEINNKFNIGSEVYCFAGIADKDYPEIVKGVVTEIHITTRYDGKIMLYYKINYKFFSIDFDIILNEKFVHTNYEDAIDDWHSF